MARDRSDHIDTLIGVAAERGIITADQRDALGALRAELQRAPAAAVEAGRGFNSVTVAYAIGAILVAFGSAWFLADRWDKLGPWGVLAVAAAYASLLIASSAWLERRNFRHASAIALMLAVTLVPVPVWSVEVLTGFWPAGAQSDWLSDSNQWMAVCWVIIDLATLLAALVAMRRRPSVALTIPMAAVSWLLCLQMTRAVAGEYLTGSLSQWLFMVDGLMVCLIAGEVDRWQSRARVDGRGLDGDYAFFFWLVGLTTFAIAYMAVWARAGAGRHLMLVVALILVALSLALRRRTHLVFGLLGLFGYLAYLALDAFRNYLSLPVILGTLGVVLILATVWVQRRFPRLVERVNAERRGSVLPAMVTRGPAILALGIALLSIPELREEMEQQAFSRRVHILRMHSGSARLPKNSIVIPRREATRDPGSLR